MKSIRNILAITKLEMQKKKKTYKPRTLILLVSLMVIFFGATYILFSSGFIQENKFYETYSYDDGVQAYLNNSKFNLDEQAGSRITKRSGDYLYSGPRTIQESAAQSAFLTLIKKTNDQALDYVKADPKRLLYVNITPIFREELLNPLNQSTSDEVVEDVGQAPGIEDLAQGEEVLENSQETASSDNTNEPVTQNNNNENNIETAQNTENPSTGSLVKQDIVNQELDSNNIISEVQNANTELAVREVNTDDLLSPADINTFGFVKDLFIFLQILFVLNLASGLFGTAILQEKINQRSSLLFMANVSRWEFIIGKMLAYFIPSFVILLVLLALQNSTVLAHFPVYLIIAGLVILFLTVSCLNGLLARNHKEYSFLNVFSISGLSLYLLIPAFLSNISELSYASLLTPITFYSQDVPVSLPILLFVIPAYFIVSVILLHLASQAWNFERLYRFQSPFDKLLLLLRYATNKYIYLVFYGMASVAFAWLGQLLLIAFLLTNSLPFKLVLFLVFGAFVEEYFRNMIVYAMKKHESPLLKKEFLVAALIGLGFIIAEKGFLLVSIAPYLEGFQILVLGGVFVPFLLHTGFVYAYIKIVKHVPFLAKRFIMTTFILAVIHAIINITILGGLGQIEL